MQPNQPQKPTISFNYQQQQTNQNVQPLPQQNIAPPIQFQQQPQNIQMPIQQMNNLNISEPITYQNQYNYNVPIMCPFG